jgi:hypothetical protein
MFPSAKKSKGELCVIQAAIQEKLDKRAILREEKVLIGVFTVHGFS